MKIIVKTPEEKIEKEIPVDTSRTILSQLRNAGVEMHSACHAGICGACICTIEQGGENINKSFRGEPGFPLGEDEVMTCIGGVIKKDDVTRDIILKKIY